MSGHDGPGGHNSFASRFNGEGRNGSLETMMFEALVHQLIEKGLLTKNDALSTVQTVAQVKSAQLDELGADPRSNGELRLLRRVYESFEAIRDRSVSSTADCDNVRELRPPLHRNAPEFPQDG